jgi:hypothetical protein
MSPGMVRLGGICAFLVIAIMIIGTFVVAGMAVDAARTGGAASAAGGMQVGSIVIGLLVYICLIMTLWTSRGLFNGFSYSGGNMPVMITIAAMVIGFILSFAGGAGVTQMTTPQAMAGTGSAMGIVSFIVSLVMFIGFIWFSLACLGFGGKAKMGLWKAIGILYLIMGACFAIMMLIMIIMVATKSLSTGMASFAGVMALIGMLVGLAALICHGIGLLIGAGRMGGQAA